MGNYTLRNLPVGIYRVRVSMIGFREAVIERVNITAGVVTRENVTLQIGELAESITVLGSATLLRTDTAELSFHLESKEIRNLPLNVYRNYQALNARNFFNWVDRDGDGKADKPAGNRNIGGFTIGGPIVRDKLFFFGGWEGTFQRVARQTTATVATAAMRSGDFSDFSEVIYDPLTGNPQGSGKTPFPGNIIPQDRMSPAALKMQSLLPLPNRPGLTSNYEISGTEAMDRQNYDVKVDWYLSDAHRFWGKFSWLDAEVRKDSVFGPGGGGAIGWGGDGVGDTDVKVYGIGHNWTISPTFLIDANFGYTDMDQVCETADLALGNFGRDVLGIPGVNAAEGQDQACIVDGVNRCGGIPYFGVDGFSVFGQTDGWSPLWRDENSATFTQNFS